MTRISAWSRCVRMAGVAAVVVALTSGCQQPGADYCKQLTEEQPKIAKIVNGGDPTALIKNVGMLKHLAGAAPRDLTDEWQMLLNAVQSLRQALQASGLDQSSYDPKNLPDDLSGDQRRAIKQAADRLASPEIVKAAEGIDQQARDVCKVNLGSDPKR